MTLEPLVGLLARVQESIVDVGGGEVADYIPELAKADASAFAMSVATVDGEVASIGNLDEFTIQSISKPFVYALALADRGPAEVLRFVGTEPTGDPFNSISLDKSGRAPNPMVNAGAMVTTNLVGGDTAAQRWDRIITGLSAFAGRQLGVDADVFASEQSTGDRNRAIAYLMRTADLLGPEVLAEVDLYFRQCSVIVNSQDLAIMGATLANAGKNPITGEQVIPRDVVAPVLTVMATCGMYDYAGEWLYRVGLPAKSGVSGGVVAALPGQVGIGVYSPPLDARGNSVRGVAAAQKLSESLGFHLLLPNERSRSGIKRTYSGAIRRSMRVRPVWERTYLDEHGDEIFIVELSGDQGFATGAAAARVCLAAAQQARVVVLDFRQATRMDDAARSLFESVVERLTAEGVAVRLVEPSDTATLASIRKMRGEVLTMSSIDAALEWAEDIVLDRHGASGQLAETLIPLAEQELLHELSVEQRAVIEAAMTTRIYMAGTIVFEEGAAADGVYFLGAGLVSVEVRDSRTNRFRRINTVPAGAAFGELALIDGGTRSTRIVALEPCVCHVLTSKAWDELSLEAPSVAADLARSIARSLSVRLRRATALLSLNEIAV